jgi:hypothetical protein
LTRVTLDRRKVEPADVRQALSELGAQARYNQLRQQIMTLAECSKRTAQLAIAAAWKQGWIVQADGRYGLPGYLAKYFDTIRNHLDVLPAVGGGGASDWAGRHMP